MRVVLSTFGFNGDATPVVALAAELRRAGHEPILVLSSTSEASAVKAGLQYVSIPSIPEAIDGQGSPTKDGFLRWFKQATVALPDIHSKVIELCRDAALLIGSPFDPICKMVQECVPATYVSLHRCPFFELSHEAREAGASLINEYRRNQGNPIRPDAFACSSSLALYAVSKYVFERPARWRHQQKVVGFLPWDGSQRKSEQSFDGVWAGSDKPIVLALNEAGPGTMQSVIEALRATGHKAILTSQCEGQERWATTGEFHVAAPDQQRWLFSRASVVVHQGDASASADAFCAGVPTIVVPNTGVQKSWAELARSKGCARNVLPVSQLNAARLAAAIRGTVVDAGSYQAAATLAQQIETENGAAAARFLLEELGARRCNNAIVSSAEAVGETPRATKQTAIPLLEPVKRNDNLPLSFAQQRLWVIDQFEGGGTSYNMTFGLRLAGDLNYSALHQSIHAMVHRHEILRTVFPASNGKPMQKILEQLDIPLEEVSLEHVPVSQQESEVVCRLQEEIDLPFDLAQGPLLRMKLLRLGAEDHVLMGSLHHIVSDGWSVGIMLKEISVTYAAYCLGEEPSLPALKVQYADYAVWQRAWLEGEVLQQQLGYWKPQLAGIPVLELPTDRPRPAAMSYQGGCVQWMLPVDRAEQLRQFSRQRGLTSFMVLLAGLQITLSKYTCQDDIAVGTPIANRNRKELEDLIGCFVNTLVLRTVLDGSPTFDELLQRIRQTTVDAYLHQDLPFERLVQELHPERDLTRTPFFQVMLALQNIDSGKLDLPGLRMTKYLAPPERIKFDLMLDLMEWHDGKIGGDISYACELYDKETVLQLLHHFELVIETMIAGPKQNIQDFCILTGREREQLLFAWNRTEAAFPRKTVQQLLQEQARRTPHAVAVKHGDEKLTYAELDHRCAKVADYLQSCGARPGEIIGLMGRRNLNFIVGMIAIWKMGAAYLPLDGNHPPARWQQIMGQSRAPWILAEDEFLGEIEAAVKAMPAPHSTTVLSLGKALRQEYSESSFALVPGSERDLAYVIYTSGSTGLPKGVMVEQRGFVNHLYAMTHDLQLGPEDCMAQTASQNFDISVWQFVTLLVLGGRTEIVHDDAMHDPAALWELIREREITIVELVPSLLADLARVAENKNRISMMANLKLRWFLVTGEAVTPQACRDWITACPNIRLLNAYGPAECSDDVTLHEIRAGEVLTERVPIGRPIANFKVYLLDRYLNPVPVGAVGELYIGGAGVGRGYLGDIVRTADAFLPDGFSGEAGSRLYRTGDLARYRRDGILEYLGRTDHQVKVRGYRIELGEIEATLAEHAGVRAAAVTVADGETQTDKRLIAYVTLDEGASGAKPGTRELRNWLKTRLPEYMVPSVIVELERLPLSDNGKIDRKSLPKVKIERSGEYIPPRTGLQQVLASVWANVLKIDRIGLEDNFFDLGGHSLLGTQLMSRVQEVFNVALPLRALFEHSTLESLAEFIEEDLRKGSVIARVSIPRYSAEQRKKLSYAQQRLWFLHQLQPESASYNVAAAVKMTGTLEIEALRQSFNELLKRHEILRSTFVMGVNAEPKQKVAESLQLDLPVCELAGKDDEEKWQAAYRLSNEEARTPFDLYAGPLFRAQLLRIAPTVHVALLTMHHIVSDGWSMGILIEEMAELYRASWRGEKPQLADLPIQYGDYAAWQREWLQGEVLENQLAYWRKQLDGISGALELPTDHPRPAVQSYHGSSLGILLEHGLPEKLYELAKRENVTLFMLLMAAFHAFLWRYSGQRDIAVGTPIANRTCVEAEKLIGFFVNTLVIRNNLQERRSFIELLAGIRETTLGAYAHQDIPFEKLVEEVKPERDLSRSPLFQVLFALQNVPQTELRLDNLELDLLWGNLPGAKFDLSLKLEEVDGKIEGGWEYNTDLFEEATIARMAGHWHELLQGIVAGPENCVIELPFLSLAERTQVLQQWNHISFDHVPKRVMELFEEQAERTSALPALVCEDRQLTYAELNRLANQTGHYLQRLGVGPDVPVGLCLDRSLEMVLALLGVLKAGGAYVPLDPAYPNERLSYMLEDAQAAVLITNKVLASRFTASAIATICLDQDWEKIQRECGTNLVSGVQDDNLAYVIYTSGSTGRPKGVGVTHAALSNYVQSVIRKLEVEPGWNWAWASTVAADLGNTMLFPALCCGGALHVISTETARDARAMAEYAGSRGLDCLKITPTHLQSLLQSTETAQVMPAKRLVLGGEASSWEWVAGIQLIRESCRIWNHYGPTETTVGVAMYEARGQSIPQERSRVVPIGTPLDNAQLYVLGEEMEAVGIGVPGELYIGGRGLARGYLGKSEVTAERFVPNPYAEQQGERLYRTGDRARWLAEGQVEYLGRMDAQVKLRGYRVELGEIESVLAEQAEVKQAAVLVHGDASQKRLIAYVVCKDGMQLEEEALRAHARAKLPEYMVPSVYVSLQEMPLTANGKLDRRALPEPHAPGGNQEHTEPSTVEETILCSIWSEVLQLDRVNVKDNFFDLGGHSLLATQVVARVREIFQVELPLQKIFEQPTISELAKTVQQLNSGKRTWRPRITPAERSSCIPLSYAQQRLWFIAQFTPGDASYNVPRAVRIAGPLEIDALQKTLAEIIRRHEILRTCFPIDEDGPYQVAGVHVIPPAVLDMSGVEDREAEAGKLVEEEVSTTFNLATGPLLRMKLLRLNDEDHLLLLMMHHIISDAWSAGILVREMSELYEAFRNGQPSPLPELPIQYADFSVWQRTWLSGEILEQELDYWRNQLAGVSVLDLPTDYPRSSSWSSKGATLDFILNRDLTSQLKDLGRKNGATLYMNLLAAFQVLLGRYSGQEDVAVGSPISGRTHAETENLIGCFLNTLVLRADVQGHESWHKFLKQVRRTALEAYAHQEAPFEKLVEELQPVRDLQRSPLFQAMFILQNAPLSDLRLGEAELRPFPVPNRTATFELTLSFIERRGELRGSMEYRADLFKQQTIESLLHHYQVLLNGILQHPEQALADLPLLAQQERQQILVEWNSTDNENSSQKCVHEFFAEQVERTPDALAIVHENQRITYAELYQRANQLAHYLRKLGAGPGSLVGICIERSPDLIVALLGVLQTGGAYLPLDPGYPPERLSYIVEDASVQVLISQAQFAPGLHKLCNNVVCLDRERSAIDREQVTPLANHAVFNAVAYTIYTSGSTGKPKGVQITHRNLMNLLQAMRRCPGLSPGDRLVAVTTISFDIAALEIYLPLITGAQIVLASRETALDGIRLLKLIQSSRATVMQATPATWRLLMEVKGENVPALKILCGGEALPQDLADQLVTCGEVWNLYGPTETTIWSSVASVRPKLPISIGAPIQNTRLYLLDKWGQPVPVGVPGELYIGGDGVAVGYHNRPAMTAEKFLPDPFSPLAGQRLYRTGDLMRYLPGGRLEFLGRRDQQIKIRGFRVELGEIEAALAAHDSVEQACVVMRTGETGEKYLAAYVVFKAGLPATPGDHQIKEYLRTQLPEYMVPLIVVELQSMPLTANGKLDRKALPDVKAERKGEYVAPRNAIEEVLVRRWMDLLKLPRIGVHDNFFDLGGHSLLATRVISRIAKDFRIDVPLLDFFSKPTIAALAGSLKSREPKPDVAEKIARILNKVDRLSTEQVKAELHGRKVAALTSGDD